MTVTVLSWKQRGTEQCVPAGAAPELPSLLSLLGNSIQAAGSHPGHGSARGNLSEFLPAWAQEILVQGKTCAGSVWGRNQNQLISPSSALDGE